MYHSVFFDRVHLGTFRRACDARQLAIEYANVGAVMVTHGGALVGTANGTPTFASARRANECARRQWWGREKGV